MGYRAGIEAIIEEGYSHWFIGLDNIISAGVGLISFIDRYYT